MISLYDYQSDPILCPFCKSENIIKHAPAEPDLDFVVRGIKCLKCKKAWEEIYRLTEVRENFLVNRRIEAMKTRKEKGWDKENENGHRRQSNRV